MSKASASHAYMLYAAKLWVAFGLRAGRERGIAGGGAELKIGREVEILLSPVLDYEVKGIINRWP